MAHRPNPVPPTDALAIQDNPKYRKNDAHETSQSGAP